ncbi:DUF455 family protein [Cohnella nanjingensis]|uniref:DUF455 family protein n=1 Tax=Cohnella nanjingensis TaxID=1387779 RepID=A0A7X0VHY0_9BACL|nr:DUF455 family protein [Cohnella nanjingensis]MBB6674617.1 DUF455 family protein [Cohnella nanjingensis]
MIAYFSSEEALKKLKLFFSLEFDLIRHTIGYCPRIPRYLDKCQFVRHVYEDLKRSRMLRERIQDFGLAQPEKQLNEAWTNLVRHLMSAADVDLFIAAFYRVVKVEQVAAYRSYIQNALRLNDAPSVEVFEDHLPAMERQLAWGKQFVEAGSISADKEREVIKFEIEIREHIARLGNLYGGSSQENVNIETEYPDYAVPAEMELEPRFIWRSAERIYDSVNQSEEHPTHHSYTHFTELPIIDLVANIVYDGKHMPFEYLADFIRQAWDEARHSQMGFSRLRSMGVDPYQVPIPVGHYKAYTSVPLLERIAALTQVGEACSFVPKKQWTKMAIEHNDLLTALEHDYDIVDEKNHVKFGVKWINELIKKNNETRNFKQIVQDAEWKVRTGVNELKKEKGEKWQADLGPRFEGCHVSNSPLNLAPNIIIA